MSILCFNLYQCHTRLPYEYGRWFFIGLARAHHSAILCTRRQPMSHVTAVQTFEVLLCKRFVTPREAWEVLQTSLPRGWVLPHSSIFGKSWWKVPRNSMQKKDLHRVSNGLNGSQISEFFRSDVCFLFGYRPEPCSFGLLHHRGSGPFENTSLRSVLCHGAAESKCRRRSPRRHYSNPRSAVCFPTPPLLPAISCPTPITGGTSGLEGLEGGPKNGFHDRDRSSHRFYCQISIDSGSVLAMDWHWPLCRLHQQFWSLAF